MTIADLSEVWVTAMVPEAEISAVAHGQDAEVALDAYPHDVLRGKVAFVSDVIEPDTRRDKLRIAFPNADYKLKPNMFATATLIGPPRNLVVLPASAILMNNDRVTVFIETAPWTFQRRTVTADLQDDGSAAIIAGLSGGEKVVVAGGVLLND
jgi:cobalt-zinc-cadmium efflux system membrane fusion protein